MGVASRVASNEGLPKRVKYMVEEETRDAPSPGAGIGAGRAEGEAAPGPRWWETPECVRRSGDVRPRREGCLPRELRIKLYNDVVALRRCGLTYGGIVEEVYRRYGVRISKSSISEWLHGIHSPYNGRRIPSLELLKPSEELAYVIGAVLGDGYAHMRRRIIKGYSDSIIGLEARDREFVEEFGRRLAKVLNRREIRPRYRRSSGRYVVEAKSKTLYELLRKPVDLDRLKPYVEHCERCVAAFIRSFADSEGCVDKKGRIHIYNTDLRLLTYIKELLRRLGIDSADPKLHTRRGTIKRDPRTGRQYVAKKDVYVIYVRARSNTNFYRYVGFTITRKQRRLEEYVKNKTTPPPTFFHPASLHTTLINNKS
jgi:intein-encoded DNA endonuclease-like protein